MPKNSKPKTKNLPKVKKPLLVLIDSHAIIHRAYHALPDLTDAKGEPAGALYGLSTMLVKLIKELKPEYVVAAYDLAGPTHRHEIYEDYKGTRAKTEDSLIDQITRSRDIFKIFHIPIYEAKGFEADDVIGTLATTLKSQFNIIIASGDMDTLQLVDDKKVQVFTLRKGITDTILYDEKAVIDRFGFGPEYIADYKGFAGDPSDNIIGITGVGAKTATTLIQTYGSMEQVYKKGLKNFETFKKETGLTERIFNLLKDNQDEAEFSKVLATIRIDTPIDFDENKAFWKENFSTDEAEKFFADIGFRSLISRIKTLNETEGPQEPSKEVVAPEVTQTADQKKEAKKAEQQKRAVQEAEPDFKESSVMFWILQSDATNPSPEDVLSATNTKTFAEAKKILFGELKKEKLLSVYEDIEKPLIPIIATLNSTGVLVNKKYLEKLSKEYHKELDTLSKNIFKKAGQEFNVNSPKQLGEVLFVSMGIKQVRQKKTATGQFSTKESELVKLKDEHPIISDILAYRELQKLLSTYIDAIPPLLDGSGRLRTTFVQTGTTTGRLSSREPNLQNIPVKSELGRRIRSAFVAKKGHTLVAFDYSQIELRLAAFLSGDEKLREIFMSGEDVHSAVASEVFEVSPENVAYEMRRRAKIINFGILYGMGVNALRVQLGTERAEAQEFMNQYFETFTGLAEYLTKTKATATRVGYTTTFFGRKRFFPGLKSKLPFVRASAERMAINAPIQGTQADIIKLAMVRVGENIDTHFKETAKMVLQIHDELIFEVKDEVLEMFAKETKEIMESVLTKEQTDGIPITVSGEAGASWGDMKPLYT